MRLFWTQRARRDLLAIADHIGADSPAAARRTINSLRERAGSLPPHPLAGRVVPELGKHEIRELVCGNYRLVYLIGSDRLLVLTIFEGHRMFPEDVVAPEAGC